MMLSLISAFLTSFIITFLIIRLKDLHSHISADFDLSGPQKFHTQAVPRIGGISIAVAICMAITLKLKNINQDNTSLVLLICALPTFTVGLSEDLTKKVSVTIRLFFTLISAGLFVSLLGSTVTKLDIPIVDNIFNIPHFAIIFTIFSITGLANAYNIIDGFNGLASMVGIITLLALAYVGFIFSDLTIIYLSLIMVGAIVGFFVWNYPLGLIFLGDGGAYLIGFWIASLSIMTIHRHPEISPWFALLINGYPILETLFTIYRRKIHQGKNPGKPDGIHFHTLIYRRILNKKNSRNNWLSANAKTAPYFWILTSLSIAPALIWWDSTIMLSFASLVFVTIYICLYSKIVRFKTPTWLIP